MNTIAELFDDFNCGLVHLKTEHQSLAANVLRVDGVPGPDVYMLNEAGADFALWALEGRAYFEVLELPLIPPEFLQCNPPWSNKLYSPTGSLTFCKAGCLVCSTAAQAAHAGYNVNPISFAHALADQGAFQGNYLQHPTAITRAYPRLLWHKANDPTFWSPRYKRKETSLIHWRERPADLELLQTLLSSQPVVLEVDYDPQDDDIDQHFVLAYQYIPDPAGGLNDDLKVMDPMAGHTSVLSYFNPHWLNDWMRRNQITKTMRTITGARVWEIIE